MARSARRTLSSTTATGAAALSRFRAVFSSDHPCICRALDPLQMKRELAICSLVNHPNIIRTFCHFSDHQAIYILQARLVHFSTLVVMACEVDFSVVTNFSVLYLPDRRCRSLLRLEARKRLPDTLQELSLSRASTLPSVCAHTLSPPPCSASQRPPQRRWLQREADIAGAVRCIEGAHLPMLAWLEGSRRSWSDVPPFLCSLRS